MKYSNRRARSFPKQVGKGTAKKLGGLGGSIVRGVFGELASILTLGLYRRPRKRH